MNNSLNPKMLTLTRSAFWNYNGAAAPMIITQEASITDPPGDIILDMVHIVWGVVSAFRSNNTTLLPK
jgi:hypothetical protein